MNIDREMHVVARRERAAQRHNIALVEQLLGVSLKSLATGRDGRGNRYRMVDYPVEPRQPSDKGSGQHQRDDDAGCPVWRRSVRHCLFLLGVNAEPDVKIVEYVSPRRGAGFTDNKSVGAAAGVSFTL